MDNAGQRRSPSKDAMLSTHRNEIVCWTLMAIGAVSFALSDAKAERLPIKTYTTTDGLAHNSVNRIVRDSRGFLWFCTNEGLSRFDGYSFTNYGIDQGLPSASINSLLETREGSYWVATGGGLCRFNPNGRSLSVVHGPEPTADQQTVHKALRTTDELMFITYFPSEDARSKHVLSLFEDRAGDIWCGTRNGLYRVEAKAGEVKFTFIDLGVPDQFEDRYIECFLEDHRGALWVGSRKGLFRRWPDGRVEAYTNREGLPHNVILSLLEDREGHIWVGTGYGWLCRLVTDPPAGRNVVARAYTHRDGLPSRTITDMFQASDGSLWAASGDGLVRFIPTAGDFRFRVYGQAHGLSDQSVKSLAEDRNGNMWLATPGGIGKIARNGFTTFTKADGFSQSRSLFETKAGDVIVLGWPGGAEWFVNRFDGEKFIRTLPQFSGYVKQQGYGWGWNQTLLEDRTGDWWIATFAGVCRFPKVSKLEQLGHTSPKAIYTTRDGLANNNILRLFEDTRGDAWIGSVGHGQRPNGLSRWERSTNTFHHYTEKDNLPRFDIFFVSSFAEDRAGNLWIGFSGDGGLVRYRHGRFTLFTTNEGVPAGQLRNMLVDSAGRLWIASFRSGLIRVDDPTAERPRFVTYTTADGLSSNEAAAVCEDGWGRIYIGTARGIDRLDLAAGRIKHYTTADGLPLSTLHSTLRDRNGVLWFSFQTGVARLVPESDPSAVPPLVMINSLRIAGEVQQISALGETEIAAVELGPDKNQLQIDFVALGFSPGEGLRYQYKLEGGSEDWSQLSDQRTVNFANLAPGGYRFLVRAINADGVMSEAPASFSFRILPPVWQRWWFIVLAVALVGLIAYALYSYRVRRLLEIERVRTRIATDLHDDIGSSLSQIAIMSEVVQQQVDGQNPRVSHPLAVIAGTSRELVDSMADIVWAINPKRDHLTDLTQRMRQFAADLLSARNIEFRFDAPGQESDTPLETDMRREVFLILKEAVNNAVRHSNCSFIEIVFAVNDKTLMLNVTDNGNGFDPLLARGGHGLVSMKRRAENIGGTLGIFSEAGGSTTITLQAPLRRRHLRRMKITT